MRYKKFAQNTIKLLQMSVVRISVRQILLASIVLLIGTHLFAQNHQEHVSIVGSFQPVLGDFSKIALQPESETTQFSLNSTALAPVDTILAGSLELELISPLSLKTEETRQGYRSYLKAGIGSRFSPLFVFRHSTALSRKTDLGIGITHYSSWLNMKDLAPSSFMKSEFSLALGRAFSDVQTQSQVFYRQHLNRYYGFNPDHYAGLYIDVESITQNYQTLGFQSDFRKLNKREGNPTYEGTVKYQLLKANFGTSEHRVLLKGRLDRPVDLIRTENIQSIVIQGDVKTNIFKNTLSSHNDVQVNLRPSFGMTGDFFQFSVGANLVFHSETRSEVHLFPDLSGELFVLDKKLKFYAALTGYVQQYDYQYITTENPFVSPLVEPSWQHNLFQFSGGVKVFASKQFDVHLSVKYCEIAHDLFFVRDTMSAYNHQFGLLFDDVKLLQISAESALRLNNNLNIEARYQYSQYKTLTFVTAFDKPANSLELKGTYPFTKMVNLSATIYYVGERQAAVWSGASLDQMRLKPYVDVNAGLDYQLNEGLRLFATVENLFNWSYERFDHYPVHGIELFAGIKVRF